MSHVTQEQAKHIGALGFPQSNEDTNIRWHVGSEKGYTRQDMIAFGHLTAHEPSAEELMEWLPSENPHAREGDFTGWDFKVISCRHHDPKMHVNGGKWVVGYEGIDGYMDPEFAAENLIDALYSCACWVLEGKK